MNARDLSYIALSVALISVSAWIALPIGEIPITMQTTAIFLVAWLLGAKRATFAVGAYILLGAMGVPVFAGFTGGIFRLLSPTGGYIIGFLLLALAVGLASDFTAKKEGKPWRYFVLAALVGMVLCYAFGSVWFVMIALQNGDGISILTICTLCVLPYLPFDLIKIILVAFLLKKRRRIFKTL